MPEIKVVNRSEHPLPEYQSSLAAGLDLRANLAAAIELAPGERVLVKTGISLALPGGYEAQVRPRSGLALKKGVTVLNSPGTIDADYRGELGVILINHGQEAVSINNGDRVAQLVVAKVEQLPWREVEALENTERGAGGFGSTGAS